MNLWDELYKFAKSRSPHAITTTLLGKVDYTINKNGVAESVIPASLSDTAKRHGLMIVAADFRDNTYTLDIRARTE